MSQHAPKLSIEKNNPKLPSEKIIENEMARMESEVVDINGRVYKLRLPEAIDELDLNVALGREHSANMGVLVMAMPLLFIDSIDGVPFIKPNSYPEIRAAIKRIGKQGLDVVTKAMIKYQESSQISAEDISNIKK